MSLLPCLNYSLYTPKMLNSNESYNDVLPVQHVREDFRQALAIAAELQIQITGTQNIGDNTKQQKDLPYKWAIQMYDQFEETYHKTESLVRKEGKEGDIKFVWIPEEVIIRAKKMGTLFSKQSSNNKHLPLLRACENNLDLLTQIHKSPIVEVGESSINSVEYIYLLQKGDELLSTFFDPTKLKDDYTQSQEMLRFSTLVQCVFVLNKIQRLDLVSKYYQLASFNNVFDKDSEGKDQIHRIKHLVDALEYYQVGKWEQSVISYSQFLKKNYQILETNIWIRLMETAWYLAIVTFWASQENEEGVYLPASALNYVYEDCTLIKDEQDSTQNFYQIHTYTRNIDIQPPTTDPLPHFTTLFSTFTSKNTLIYETSPQHLPKLHTSMFNMLGTLLSNTPTLPSSLSTCACTYIDLISSTEILDPSNIDKFVEYFGSQTQMVQFKNDFF